MSRALTSTCARKSRSWWFSARISMRRGRRSTSRNRDWIAVLLGEYPETLAVELARGGPTPVLPQHVPVGIPADLLRRRPDIQGAERQLAAANADIGAAIADLFPDVVLTGAVGGHSGPTSSSLLLPYT